MIAVATKIVKHINKQCLYCGMAVSGRSDKKFCDDTCRSHYHNELTGAANNYIRNVNRILGKNRRILEAVLSEAETATTKVIIDKLIDAGYNFKYHTHQYNSPNGKVYFYCYEYGYLRLENNWCLIVRRKE